MRNFPASWLKFLKRFWKESKTSFMTFSAFRLSPRRLHNSGLTSEAQFWRRIRPRRRTFAQADVAIEMGSRSDSKTFLGTRMHWLSSADGLRSQKNFARAQFNVSSEYFEWKWRDFDHFLTLQKSGLWLNCLRKKRGQKCLWLQIYYAWCIELVEIFSKTCYSVLEVDSKSAIEWSEDERSHA